MSKIAFIGVGNMASAIIFGITSSDTPILWEDIILFDKFTAQYDKFGDKPYITAESAKQAASSADCVILATKPQNFPEVLSELSGVPDIEKKLIITIAAGITTDTVSHALGGARVVRVLPNTPMLIGMGVTAACRNNLVSDEDFEYAISLFRPSGSVTVIDESEMNRIISVTSSSPAYVFGFIKAICDGATAQGLDGEALTACVCDMVIGSATLMKKGYLESGKTAEEQISTVASKGGTTERAMASLASDGFDVMIRRAMQACTDRADELSRG
ncbi:MAG: pyrroline-5-carboxylate reductase [Ruminococcaceae bacterium]|nr:pyrroline-5-carboxylate reductase [Oscillospiraceae bacterium]